MAGFSITPCRHEVKSSWNIKLPKSENNTFLCVVAAMTCQDIYLDLDIYSLYSDNLFDIHSGILFGIYSGNLSDIYSDLFFGVLSDICSAILSETYAGVLLAYILAF